MRTNIEIDPDLKANAMKLTGAKTKREVVEEGLRTIVRLDRQRGMLKLRGEINWVGDLDEMRRD